MNLIPRTIAEITEKILANASGKEEVKPHEIIDEKVNAAMINGINKILLKQKRIRN